MSDYLRSTTPEPTEMTRVTIRRTGARPYVGRVIHLGHGDAVGTGTTVHVRIWRRERGGYIVSREHRTIWHGDSDSYEATLCSTPDAVLAECGGDERRGAEDEAWCEACEQDDALAEVSRIEI